MLTWHTGKNILFRSDYWESQEFYLKEYKSLHQHYKNLVDLRLD